MKSGGHYRPNHKCMTCEQEKPCSFHGLRQGFVCADCWVLKDLPQRTQDRVLRDSAHKVKYHPAKNPRPRKPARKPAVSHAKRPKVAPPPHPDAL